MTRHLILDVLILVAFGAGTAWAQDRPNFSGEWVLNLAKTTTANKGITGGTVRIDHKEPVLKFRRTLATADGPSEGGYDLTTDGKEKVTTSGSMTRRSRMYWEGGELVLDEKIEMSGRTATNVVHYRLENGGAVLVARETEITPRSRHDNVWVFERK